MLIPDGHIFRATTPHGDQAPFFWLGDTQWQLFRSFSLDEVRTILKTRQRQGFNVLQVMLTGVGDGTQPNLYGHTPWIGRDPASPNPAYFENVDAVVRLARDEGFILAIYLCHNTQKDSVTPANARAYARWVAQRYQDEPHLVYVFVTEVPIAEHLEIIRELAGGVREGDGGRRLIAYHPDPVNPALSSGEIHQEAWLAFNMIQTWNYYEGIYGCVRRDYLRQPLKPVVMAEGAYEDGPDYNYRITPWLIRQQAYWSYLAGGFHSYGHSANWLVPPDWQTHLESPGAKQMTVLKSFFSTLDWWNLAPDQGIIKQQSIEGSTLNTAARSTNGAWLCVYFHRPTTITVDLSKLAQGHRAEVTWFDPRDGAALNAGKYPLDSQPAFTTPEGWEDALLLAKAEAHQTAPNMNVS